MDQPVDPNDSWYGSTIKGFDFDDGGSKNGGVSFFDAPSDEKINELTAKTGTSLLVAPKSVFSAEPAVKLIKCSGPCGRELKPSERYYRMYLPYCKPCLEVANQPEKSSQNLNTVDRVNFIIRQKLRYQTVLTDWLGDPVFRTMEGKRLLLHRTVQLSDGDSVIAALLFLRRTLKPTVFKEEACRNELRGQAVLHWLAHLQQSEEMEEYKDCLLSYVPAATGDVPNVDAVAAMNLDRALANNSEPATRLSALRRFMASETGAGRGLLGAAQTCMDLLSRQLEFENLLAEKMAGKPQHLFPLMQGRPAMTSLTLNAFAVQLRLMEPDLERLSPGLTEQTLRQLTGLMACPRDQLAWCRIVAIATRLRQAAEARNEVELMRHHGLLEGVVIERGGGFIQKQVKPALSWPISRQIEHLKRLGASVALLENLKKLA